MKKIGNKAIKLFGIGAAVFFVCLTLIPMSTTAEMEQREIIVHNTQYIIREYDSGLRVIEVWEYDYEHQKWDLERIKYLHPGWPGE